MALQLPLPGENASAKALAYSTSLADQTTSESSSAKETLRHRRSRKVAADRSWPRHADLHNLPAVLVCLVGFQRREHFTAQLLALPV